MWTVELHNFTVVQHTTCKDDGKDRISDSLGFLDVLWRTETLQSSMSGIRTRRVCGLTIYLPKASEGPGQGLKLLGAAS